MTTKEQLITLYKERLNNTNEPDKNLSDSSIVAYIGNILKLAKDMGVTLEPASFINFKQVIKFIEEHNENLNTRKNKANSVVMYLKANNNVEVLKQYGEFIMSMRDKIDEAMSKNEKSPKEEKNWLDKDELAAIASKLKDTLPTTKVNPPPYEKLLAYQQYFILQFHIQNPLRNDLATTLIGSGVYKGAENYIRIRPNIKSAEMMLREYKTEKTYGLINFKITGVALTALLEYYKILKKYTNITKGPQPLIITKDKKQISRNNYTKHFQEIFKDTGKSVSTTLIRKSVVSSNTDPTKIKELARVMGHSVDIHLGTYSKK